jgi:uncharacterized phiE125 gp8 family phage protein
MSLLTISDPADSTDLVSLSTVKAALGITGGAEDGTLGDLIAQVSAILEKRCNRTFAEEGLDQTFRLSCPEECLILSRYPVTAISSVVECDTTLTTSDYEFSASGVLRRLYNDRYCHWHRGKIVVSYRAGFGLPDDAPPELVRAAILLIGFLRTRRGSDILLRSSDIPGVMTKTYRDYPDAEALPPDVEVLVANLRKPVGA